MNIGILRKKGTGYRELSVKNQLTIVKFLKFTGKDMLTMEFFGKHLKFLEFSKNIIEEKIVENAVDH